MQCADSSRPLHHGEDERLTEHHDLVLVRGTDVVPPRQPTPPYCTSYPHRYLPAASAAAPRCLFLLLLLLLLLLPPEIFQKP